MLTTLRDVATVVAAVVTAFSAVIALLAFRTNRENQKEAVVQRAYFDYAKMALDHPDLAVPLESEVDYEKQTFKADHEKSDFKADVQPNPATRLHSLLGWSLSAT